MTILIPSYEPDVRLLNLVLQLQTFKLGPIVIVDDGSGPVTVEFSKRQKPMAVRS
ncbi:hypothetical protein P9222_29560 [Paenibacillus amylolyticus]|nr:hypothetical protein [Paenibacillus amylolyticus]WFR62322.1 hypothetical protein P9222_29560 [Paenibacillus amylolyticus]